MEKIYTIPLRKSFRKPKTNRSSYALRLIKTYLEHHLKTKDIKLGAELNKQLWERGMRNPPRCVRVKALIDDKTKEAKIELMGFEYQEFKVVKQEEKEGLKDKIAKRLGAKALTKQKEEELVEGEKHGKPEDASQSKKAAKHQKESLERAIE